MPDEYITFMKQIKQHLGIDLSLYKETQMKRRLNALRNKHGFSNFNHYFKAIASDVYLHKEFIDKVTINVSSFYRNPNRWHVLQENVLPLLAERKTHVNIWSAACSTGEEPYSIAMLMNAYYPNIKTSILATDIDGTVLNNARRGKYQKSALSDVPVSFKYKYFTEQDGLYHINDDLKSMVTFKQHDLHSDRYPEDMNLIICRNVLIYFTNEAKARIYQSISKALTSDGIVFVGGTEQIFSPEQYDLQLIQPFFYEKKQT